MWDSKDNSEKDVKVLDLCERRGSFGLMLSALRESKGMDAAAVAEKTRINLEYVQNLESGRFDALPGRLFARGFVNALCKTYGADAKEVLEQFDRLWTDDGIPQAISDATRRKLGGNPSSPSSHFNGSKRLNVARIAFLAALAGMALFVLVTAYRVGNTYVSAFMRRHPSVGAFKDKTMKILDEKEGDDSATGDGDAAKPKKTSASIHAVPTKDGNSQVLTLTVSEAVKIKIEKDGHRAVLKEYGEGVYNIPFADSADLLIYDAAAVHVSFNGNNLGTLGSKGRVRRLGFRAHPPEQVSF